MEVLKVWCLVLGLFLSVLGVPSKFLPHVVDKDLRIAEILSEKSFKLWIHNKSDAPVLAIVLSSFKTDSTMKKNGGKQDIIYFGGA